MRIACEILARNLKSGERMGGISINRRILGCILKKYDMDCIQIESSCEQSIERI
jgi:hypothetical protein